MKTNRLNLRPKAGDRFSLDNANVSTDGGRVCMPLEPRKTYDDVAAKLAPLRSPAGMKRRIDR